MDSSLKYFDRPFHACKPRSQFHERFEELDFPARSEELGRFLG